MIQIKNLVKTVDQGILTNIVTTMKMKIIQFIKIETPQIMSSHPATPALVEEQI